MMNKNYVIFILALSFLVFSCKEDSSSESSPIIVTPGIKIVNIIDISTTDFETWTTVAAENMKSQTANILSVSWNVRAEVSQGGLVFKIIIPLLNNYYFYSS
jgi:hypothetical protein